MKRIISRIALYLMIMTGILSCTGANLYKDLASNKTSDEALYEDAQKALDSGNYTLAITDILATSAAFQAQSSVKDSLAGAYAARCGMVFITFVMNLSGSADSFFQTAMNGFVGVDTSNYADCVSAKNIMEGIGTYAQRTSSENLFLAVLGMAMIGNRVRANADILPTSLGDGTVDAGFTCGPSKFPIADAAAVIEACSLVLENVAALATVASGSASSLQAISTACGATCTTITYAGASPAETDAAIIASRGLMNMQGIGLGACAGANPAACVCMSP